MSGGSLDYFSERMEEVAGIILSFLSRVDEPEQEFVVAARAMAHHLISLAPAFKAVEWALSYDWGQKRALGEISKVFPPALMADATLRALTAEIHRAELVVEALKAKS